jgi:urea transport system ATP-binding protein
MSRLRVGVAGPVGSGKTALIEVLCRRLRVVGLDPQAQQLAGGLAHGQNQWLEIAMLLVQDPELLLVDEPVAGLSDEETDRTGQLLRSLAGDHTVIVIEHDMEFIRNLDSPVTVLH